jgi:predicted transcriptional regulator
MSCNLVDLMELSSAQRQIVRLILRETMMTYDDLCVSIQELQHIDQREVDALLGELTEHEWIVSLLKNQETVYRVNLVRRASKQNQSFWTRLGVEASSVSEDSEDRSMIRGGKRKLPPAIWETLENDQPLSRAALLEAIRGRRREPREATSEFGRALRKRVLEALDAIARDETSG